MRKVAKINVDENIAILEKEIQDNESLSPEAKKSIEEHNEVIKILLERTQRRLGRSSSERTGKPKEKEQGNSRRSRDQLPSERYPEVPVVEKSLELEEAPGCECCGKKMKDLGLWETSESLTVIPKKYLIYRFLRKKYGCGDCYGGIKTAPAPPRIIPGSSYSDDFILDVALSKYCDLIPIERYVAMASRQGLAGLPPQSLIGLTHHLANFLEEIYERLKDEVRGSPLVHADETPHRMLEGGGDKKSWYLWGFSSGNACFFEVQNSRSGDVASNFLKGCVGKYLMSDVFSGYHKAVRETNELREKQGNPSLLNAYCNAHARRYFKRGEESFTEEVKVFLSSYSQIYALEHKGKDLSREGQLQKRKEMLPYFKQMEKTAKELQGSCSPGSSLGKGIHYFLKNWKGLTYCLEDPLVPLDNNFQERLLRAPVVGRKTWYGTHSKRGAQTSGVLFSLVGACHINGVNPREYFKEVVQAIHKSRTPVTPYEFFLLKREDPPSLRGPGSHAPP